MRRRNVKEGGSAEERDSRGLHVQAHEECDFDFLTQWLGAGLQAQ